MKKLLIALPMIALLAACGTTDPYGKRAEDVQRRNDKAMDKAADAMPDWYSKVPTSSSAIYAAGMGEASTIAMAVAGAESDARAKICYSADGTVTSQTKDFATGRSSTSSIERVTRTNCNNVKIAGSETAQVKGKNPIVVRTGSKFTAYVLVALPTGDANVQRNYIDNRQREEREAIRKEQAYNELPKNN